MTLGEIIAQLEQAATAEGALEALGDIVLHTEVVEMGAHFGEEPGHYIAAGVRRFTAAADDETWISLMSTMGRAEDPGQAALRAITRWALARDRQIECASHTHLCASAEAGDTPHGSG